MVPVMMEEKKPEEVAKLKIDLAVMNLDKDIVGLAKWALPGFDERKNTLTERLTSAKDKLINEIKAMGGLSDEKKNEMAKKAETEFTALSEKLSETTQPKPTKLITEIPILEKKEILKEQQITKKELDEAYAAMAEEGKRWREEYMVKKALVSSKEVAEEFEGILTERSDEAVVALEEIISGTAESIEVAKSTGKIDLYAGEMLKKIKEMQKEGKSGGDIIIALASDENYRELVSASDKVQELWAEARTKAEEKKAKG